MPASLNDIFDEKELLPLIADGDQRAYKIIYDKYWDRIYYDALRFVKSPELAQDLAQETFERIWIKRGGLGKVEKFDAYLYTVAKHIILNELKKQFVPGKPNDFLYGYLVDDSTSALQRLEAKELEVYLREAVESLPLQLRTAFTLSRYEGLTHSQIASRMGISKVSSQAYIVRALLAIRKHLEQKNIYLVVLAGFWQMH